MEVPLGTFNGQWHRRQVAQCYATCNRWNDERNVNVNRNEFDQYVKHMLKATYYVRYADDFVVFSHNKHELERFLLRIEPFLSKHLKLQLHSRKVSITTLASGVDFLGWVHFLDHRVLRTSTKRRMLKRVRGLDAKSAAARSYRGMLSHGNAQALRSSLCR